MRSKRKTNPLLNTTEIYSLTNNDQSVLMPSTTLCMRCTSPINNSLNLSLEQQPRRDFNKEKTYNQIIKKNVAISVDNSCRRQICNNLSNEDDIQLSRYQKNNQNNESRLSIPSGQNVQTQKFKVNVPLKDNKKTSQLNQSYTCSTNSKKIISHNQDYGNLKQQKNKKNSTHEGGKEKKYEVMLQLQDIDNIVEEKVKKREQRLIEKENVILQLQEDFQRKVEEFDNKIQNQFNVQEKSTIDSSQSRSCIGNSIPIVNLQNGIQQKILSSSSIDGKTISSQQQPNYSQNYTQNNLGNINKSNAFFRNSSEGITSLSHNLMNITSPSLCSQNGLSTDQLTQNRKENIIQKQNQLLTQLRCEQQVSADDSNYIQNKNRFTANNLQNEDSSPRNNMINENYQKNNKKFFNQNNNNKDEFDDFIICDQNERSQNKNINNLQLNQSQLNDNYSQIFGDNVQNQSQIMHQNPFQKHVFIQNQNEQLQNSNQNLILDNFNYSIANKNNNLRTRSASINPNTSISTPNNNNNISFFKGKNNLNTSNSNSFYLNDGNMISNINVQSTPNNIYLNDGYNIQKNINDTLNNTISLNTTMLNQTQLSNNHQMYTQSSLPYQNNQFSLNETTINGQFLDQKILEKQRQLDFIENEIRLKEKTLKDKKEQLNDLEKNISEKKEFIRKYTDNFERLREDAHQVKMDLNDEEKILEKTKEDRQKEQEITKSLKRQKTDLVDQIPILKVEFEQIQKNLKEKEVILKEKSEKLSIVSQQLSETESQIEIQMTKIKQQTEQIEGKFKQLNELSTNIDKEKIKIQQKEADIESLHQSAVAMREQNLIIENQIQKREGDVHRMQIHLDIERKGIEELKQKLKEQDQILQTDKKNVDEVARSLAQQKQEVINFKDMWERKLKEKEENLFKREGAIKLKEDVLLQQGQIQEDIELRMEELQLHGQLWERKFQADQQSILQLQKKMTSDLPNQSSAPRIRKMANSASGDFSSNRDMEINIRNRSTLFPPSNLKLVPPQACDSHSSSQKPPIISQKQLQSDIKTEYSKSTVKKNDDFNFQNNLNISNNKGHNEYNQIENIENQCNNINYQNNNESIIKNNNNQSKANYYKTFNKK